jgi:hypothetical protein
MPDILLWAEIRLRHKLFSIRIPLKSHIKPQIDVPQFNGISIPPESIRASKNIACTTTIYQQVPL